jgi:hypothetical protein
VTQITNRKNELNNGSKIEEEEVRKENLLFDNKAIRRKQ